MTATAAMRAELRRMTALSASDTTYTDDALDGYIERYPLVDERGVAPYYYDTTTDPPTQVATVGWYPTYDLHAAAADVWEEKAAAKAAEYDYPVAESQPGVARNSQVYDHYRQEARRHRALRRARTAQLIAWPGPNRRGNSNIGNWPEE
jgi:hypothetical protein